MVSFTLDAVKFLLIYRYLQNTYWFKYETARDFVLFICFWVTFMITLCGEDFPNIETFNILKVFS